MTSKIWNLRPAFNRTVDFIEISVYSRLRFLNRYDCLWVRVTLRFHIPCLYFCQRCIYLSIRRCNDVVVCLSNGIFAHTPGIV